MIKIIKLNIKGENIMNKNYKESKSRNYLIEKCTSKKLLTDIPKDLLLKN